MALVSVDRDELVTRIASTICEAAEERDPKPNKALRRAEKATVYANAIVDMLEDEQMIVFEVGEEGKG